MNSLSWLLGLLPRVPSPVAQPAPFPEPVPAGTGVAAPVPTASYPAVSKGTLLGADISMWQGTPDWNLVKQHLDFVVIKATEGTGYTDPRFSSSWAGTRGLLRGAYHFARPDLGNTPEAEANWFCDVVGRWLEPGDFVALDIEVGSGNLLDWTLRWLRTVYARLGFRPVVYSYWSFFTNHGIENNSELSSYGLWLADWNIPSPPVIPGWAFVAIWQYSNWGSVPGIPGRVDLDRFFGDIHQLSLYGKPSPPVDPDYFPRIGGL